MAKYKVRYHVGPRYGGGYWQTAEFDSRSEAHRFCDRKCKEGKDAELIEPTTQERHDPNMERAMNTVDKLVDRLFDGGSDLHLF